MTTTHPRPDGRLAPALGDLAAHGIAVRRATGAVPTGADAARIRADLAARFPCGMGSYVLWATAGDAWALHCSDADVAAAVAAVCAAEGIAARRDGTVVTARLASAFAA
jgi:hypothetical protein